MNEYKVKLLPQALRDIDQIYTYIAETLFSPEIAEHLVSVLEGAVLDRGIIRNSKFYNTVGALSLRRTF